MWIFSIINVIHILTCILLIIAVLLQAGKGGGMGAAFGGGASSSVFGGRGASTVVAKITWVLAITFMLSAISLAWHSSRSDSSALAKASKKPVASVLLFK
ncbi:MAG: preprotein translocase subunit SecG, partial [Polyangia bacterium]|nr:preprotein translocase subunit SecG [Polyangia bacterium]